jgi:tight adherence protein C
MFLMKSAILSMGSLAAVLVVLVMALPFMGGDSGRARLKAIRAKREAFREELTTSKKPKNASLRERLAKKSMSAKISERLNLSKFVNMDRLRTKLVVAGWRDANTLPKFLVIRFVLPFAVMGYLAFTIYAGALGASVKPPLRPFAVLGGGLLGLLIPGIIVTNASQNRAKKLTRQFPDALDLMLVCVEAGLSIEQAFMRITEELGEAIPEIAEEFALTGAELSFLGDRRQAYVNMVTRTNLQEFKSLATALSQSDDFGTSIGGSLRALSEDSREMRVLMVEKAAGKLSPKMTIPMILLILPCMFMVLIGPAVIQVMALRAAP